MSTRAVIGEVRLSFVHVWEPNQNGKYSVTCLLPKTNADAVAKLQEIMAEAEDAGITKKWNGKKPAKVHSPVHDGDGTKENGEPFGDECKGMWVFTATSKDKPQIVGLDKHPITDQSEVYSGCYANVCINAGAYSYQGKNGIGLYLEPIQKTRDGESFGGSTPSAASVFGMPDTPSAASIFG